MSILTRDQLAYVNGIAYVVVVAQSEESKNLKLTISLQF